MMRSVARGTPSGGGMDGSSQIDDGGRGRAMVPARLSCKLFHWMARSSSITTRSIASGVRAAPTRAFQCSCTVAQLGSSVSDLSADSSTSTRLPSVSHASVERTWATHCSRRGPHDFFTLVQGSRTSNSVSRARAPSAIGRRRAVAVLRLLCTGWAAGVGASDSDELVGAVA